MRPRVVGVVVAGLGDVEWVSVGAFVVLAFVLGWACFIGLHAAGLPFVVAGNAGSFGPAVAALLVRWARREPLRGLGVWPLGRPRWYLAAYLIPPALIVSGALLEVATHYQRWAPHLSTLLPGRRPPAPQVLLAVGVVEAFTLGVVPAFVVVLGEELGWRGHLLPRLSPLGGPTAAVVTGVIWGLWHAPVIAYFGLGALTGLAGHGPSGWALAPFFCLTTVPLGVVYAWLRFRSGSVWPCVLAHAMADSGLATLAILALSTPASPLLGGPIGLLGIVPMWALAIWLVATGRVRAQDRPPDTRHLGGDLAA